MTKYSWSFSHRIFAVCLIFLTPSPALAWGLDIHRFITDQAIALLPTPMRAFFDKHRGFIVEHSIDPDLWRNAGFMEEPPRHFLDLDSFGSYPFRELPRDRNAAIQKFGKERIEREGQVPWRTVEMYERLVQAFKQHQARSNVYALDDVKFFSAALSHYISDAHVPFHAVRNYDGQLTSQHGIHSRFETELFLRYRGRIALRPEPVFRISSPLDFVFEALLKSSTFADPVLKADLAAAQGRDEYDDAYFEQFFSDTRSILERRLNNAITAVAAMIFSAWEEGGRPELPLEMKRAPRKIQDKKAG
jgi:hypothetical protein